jgi:hypothetical protein
MRHLLAAALLIPGWSSAADFRAYRVEVGQGGQWTPVGAEHGEQISNGPLEFWDTTGFSGMYTLRLLVMENRLLQLQWC